MEQVVCIGEVEEYIVCLIDCTYFLHTYILVYIPSHNINMSMTLALFDEYRYLKTFANLTEAHSYRL